MTTQDSTTQLPTRKLSHTTPAGLTFTYTVTTLTQGCWLLEADHTHCVRQFACPPAQSQWWKDLTAHLDQKYPASMRSGGNDITRRQQQMCELAGVSNPYRAHDVLMHVYLAGK